MGVAGWWGAQLISQNPVRGVTIASLSFATTEQVVLFGLLLIVGLLFVAILFLKNARKKHPDLAQKQSKTVIGWALAEGTALIGAGYLLLTGDPTVFAVGFALQLLASFVILPLPV